ncbi:helix-turn-helix domain-containing protein [Lactobacillus delbrueckii]|uniref:helix-turn-helix domain-containing protein n=1 Tax=Lactobacillus delbrueckii TaxID=1584 RepID=UPI0039954A75
MNVLQKYLDQNKITRYQVAKKTGIANTTLANAVKDTKPLSGQTVKVISAVAQALDKTPGQVLDDLIALDKKGVHPLN